MPAANASALASAKPFSATNDLTIAHVMCRYDADAGLVVMKSTIDRNKAFFMRAPISTCAKNLTSARGFRLGPARATPHA
jgi:hypothetical protein